MNLTSKQRRKLDELGSELAHQTLRLPGCGYVVRRRCGGSQDTRRNPRLRAPDRPVVARAAAPAPPPIRGMLRTRPGLTLRAAAALADRTVPFTAAHQRPPTT